ncbi:tetratricopeptide repeat-containing sensor histidine kinase [Sinomicrobium weinanense]|uniref:histidine kinase n=1 Tax=Sinomicrobium weinanense TaxID=2842200 RepID=A0A926JV13_9FLAO|nr:ATP-binding protein [Sinomicrobium weinanense]MBC9797881.1 tetratricopeptide repeat protein [Sinomicrobium weinanense]MBU3122755.1 tetratricopeptide repeat protein [Sinomicrobium weinanense]
MHKIFTLSLSFIFFFTFSTSVRAQSVTDSLRNELQKATSDSSRAALRMRIAERLPMSDSIEAENHFLEALSLVDREKHIVLTASIYADMGRLYYNLYRYEESQQYMDTAINVLKKDTSLMSRKKRAHFQMNIAALYGVNGDVRKQQEQYFRLIPVFIKLGDTANLAFTYRNLGEIFSNKKQYPRALEYYKQALHTYDESDRNSYYAGASHLDVAMCLGEMDSLQGMEHYLQEAEDILRSSGDTVEHMAFLYYLKGELAFKKNDFRKAEEMYRTGLDIARDFKSFHFMSTAFMGLANTYQEQEKYEKALAAAKEFYRLGGDLRDVSFQLTALEMLGDLEFKLNHFPESYYNLKEYIKVSDSLNEVEITKTMHQLDKQYETSQKEKQIAKLEFEKETAELRLVRNRLGIWLLLITVIALLVISILYYLYYKKGKRLISQHKRVHQLEMDTMKQEHKISLLSATIKGEEHERSRIAQDLHDGLGGLLSGIKLSLSNSLGKMQEAPEKEAVSGAVKHIDEAVDELRFIAQSLMPQVLHIQGLGEAVKQFCSKIAHPDISVTCQVINVGNDIPEDTQITVYRIIQELVNNAVKHAEASQILVQLQQSKDVLFLTVEDNGKGFDPDTTLKSGGLGMSNLKARMELLEGEMDISSAPGTGTSVNLECRVGR